ncbi:hypothetical protein FA13DRAFT_1717046 [Coprinellus micaceus]|uniref:Uncharacterized protein n=1 Tax=Coprinellus micaceus TaxID=71717 RepID=A0A4Y7SHZ2_COPMI|nr:hypothetical protein FA13DRAFT_1717046 [Coprinellus micaceus]
MPKVTSQRISYHLSLPSPTGLPPNSTFYRRSSPSTPSRPSLHTPRGLLHDFGRAPTPIIKQEYEDATLPIPAFRAVGKSELILGDSNGGMANQTQYTPQRLVKADPFDESADAEGSNVIAPQQGHAPIAPGLAQNAEPVRAQGATLRFTIPTRPRVNFRRTRALSFKAEATTARRRLRHAQTELDELRVRIEKLEHSERRLKSRVVKEKELVKDTLVEVEESRAELLRAEERIIEMEADMTTLRRDFNHYRGWWLTENLSLKTVLKEIPKRKWDTGLQAIASSSYGRFMSYSGAGSN